MSSSSASDSASLGVGATVRVTGLVKAAQHNGKVGKVSAKPANEGRIGVECDGVVLSVRRENLELLPGMVAPIGLGKEQTLTRDNALLEEFHGTRDPDSLVLYHHRRDAAFDCYSALEYDAQMLRYYANRTAVVAVLPRQLKEVDCLLICLRHEDPDQNTLCLLGFQCGRQFVGTCMLVKRRCFVCHRPGAPLCACRCACFCAGDCEASGRNAHKKLCKLVRRSKPEEPEEAALQLLD